MEALSLERPPQKGSPRTVDDDTLGIQVSSFLVMTYFLLGGFDRLPKKELHWSLWVRTVDDRNPALPHSTVGSTMVNYSMV